MYIFTLAVGANFGCIYSHLAPENTSISMMKHAFWRFKRQIIEHFRRSDIKNNLFSGLSLIFVFSIETLNIVFTVHYLIFIIYFFKDQIIDSFSLFVYLYFSPHTKDFSCCNVFLFIFRCPSRQKSQNYKKKMLKLVSHVCFR